MLNTDNQFSTRWKKFMTPNFWTVFSYKNKYFSCSAMKSLYICHKQWWTKTFSSTNNLNVWRAKKWVHDKKKCLLMKKVKMQVCGKVKGYKISLTQNQIIWKQQRSMKSLHHRKENVHSISNALSSCCCQHVIHLCHLGQEFIWSDRDGFQKFPGSFLNLMQPQCSLSLCTPHPSQSVWFKSMSQQNWLFICWGISNLPTFFTDY